RNSLHLRGPHDFANTLMRTDVPAIQSQLIDARFERHQREFVVEVNVGDDRHVRYPFADLFQPDRGIVIRHSKPDDFAAGAHHVFDLGHSGAHVRGISLCHRLNRYGSTTTDLNMLDLNWSRLTHYFGALFWRIGLFSRGSSRWLLRLVISTNHFQKVVTEDENHQE